MPEKIPDEVVNHLESAMVHGDQLVPPEWQTGPEADILEAMAATKDVFLQRLRLRAAQAEAEEKKS